MDTVITNALIVDVTGIYKADIGLKNGLSKLLEKLEIQIRRMV